MTPLFGLQQTIEADGRTKGALGAKMFPRLVYLKIISAGGHAIAEVQCHHVSPTLETVAQ